MPRNRSLFLPTAGKWVTHCSAPSFLRKKKRFLRRRGPGPVASRRAPLTPDTVFRGKKHKNYVAACDRIFSGIASFFKRTTQLRRVASVVQEASSRFGRVGDVTSVAAAFTGFQIIYERRVERRGAGGAGRGARNKMIR